jgi:hypothetical protein
VAAGSTQTGLPGLAAEVRVPGSPEGGGEERSPQLGRSQHLEC